MLTEKLLKILDHSTGERDLCKFLKENPFVLLKSLNHSGNPRWVIAEFPFGTDHRADFVVLVPFSGGFEILLIEIEPPNSKIFNLDGRLAKHANKAFEQVKSWDTYIGKNRRHFLKDIKKFAQEKNLIRSHSEPVNCSVGWDIQDFRMSIHHRFNIIIGRRRDLDDPSLERKAEFGKNSNVSIITSDRLLEGTKIIDKYPDVFC